MVSVLRPPAQGPKGRDGRGAAGHLSPDKGRSKHFRVRVGVEEEQVPVLVGQAGLTGLHHLAVVREVARFREEGR